MSAISAPTKVKLTIRKSLRAAVEATGGDMLKAFQACLAEARRALPAMMLAEDASESYPIFAPAGFIAWINLVHDPVDGSFFITDFYFVDPDPPTDHPPGARINLVDHFSRLIGLGDDTILSATSFATSGDAPINTFRPALRTWAPDMITDGAITFGDLTTNTLGELVLDGLDALGDSLRARCGRPVPCGRDSPESRSCQFGPDACRNCSICQGFDSADGADSIGPPLGLPPP